MEYLCVVCGVVLALLSQSCLALHSIVDDPFIPNHEDLQFSHMGKVYPENKDYSSRSVSGASKDRVSSVTEESPKDLPEENVMSSSSPEAQQKTSTSEDTVIGASKRLMENAPVLDLVKNVTPGNVNNTNSNSNNTTNTTTGDSNTTNKSKVDNSKYYNSTTKHGPSNYRGDTSTYVTNNFFNPPNSDAPLEGGYPRGAMLELEYLWKRINVIDEKLDKLLPVGGGKGLDKYARKGLVITFDSQTNPDKPVLDLDSKGYISSAA
ncbi:hypothetical protein BgAZ_303260 [Babesia gibsoni]|uniref:Uncharacterized protein n=1 Tax=Babesia gibsoni TaxID=33632 RepID=A0AAD8LNQ8_BABGI|nr:hypothetical protein BgAZ_303260 [Babesia gibsoni]